MIVLLVLLLAGNLDKLAELGAWHQKGRFRCLEGGQRRVLEAKFSNIRIAYACICIINIHFFLGCTSFLKRHNIIPCIGGAAIFLGYKKIDK